MLGPSVWVAAFAIVLAGCALANGSGNVGTVVDGWGIGPQFTCPFVDPDRPCAALLPLAVSALDRRNPAHAAIVSSQLHEEGPDASGNLVIRSTPFEVAVFQLADGSVSAIGVGYPGVATEPMALDYGP
jgi:hypothetical protein